MVRRTENTDVQDHAYTVYKSIGALTVAALTWQIFVLQRVWWRKYTHRLPKLIDD